MFRRTIAGAAGLLALFHVWLLGSQLWDGRLAEPGLILRWMIAAGLVGALIVVRRTGAPIWWGRKSVSIWLLAALLHGPTMAAGAGRLEALALPEAVTAVVQIAAASVMMGLGLAVLAALAAQVFAAHRSYLRERPVLRYRLGDRPTVPHIAPRPPPFGA
jgi:hypothetical protein